MYSDLVDIGYIAKELPLDGSRMDLGQQSSPKVCTTAGIKKKDFPSITVAEYLDESPKKRRGRRLGQYKSEERRRLAIEAAKRVLESSKIAAGSASFSKGRKKLHNRLSSTSNLSNDSTDRKGKKKGRPRGTFKNRETHKRAVAAALRTLRAAGLAEDVTRCVENTTQSNPRAKSSKELMSMSTERMIRLDEEVHGLSESLSEEEYDLGFHNVRPIHKSNNGLNQDYCHGVEKCDIPNIFLRLRIKPALRQVHLSGLNEIVYQPHEVNGSPKSFICLARTDTAVDKKALKSHSVPSSFSNHTRYNRIDNRRERKTYISSKQNSNQVVSNNCIKPQLEELAELKEEDNPRSESQANKLRESVSPSLSVSEDFKSDVATRCHERTSSDTSSVHDDASNDSNLERELGIQSSDCGLPDSKLPLLAAAKKQEDMRLKRNGWMDRFTSTSVLEKAAFLVIVVENMVLGYKSSERPMRQVVEAYNAVQRRSRSTLLRLVQNLYLPYDFVQIVTTVLSKVGVEIQHGKLLWPHNLVTMAFTDAVDFIRSAWPHSLEDIATGNSRSDRIWATVFPGHRLVDDFPSCVTATMVLSVVGVHVQSDGVCGHKDTGNASCRIRLDQHSVNEAMSAAYIAAHEVEVKALFD